MPRQRVKPHDRRRVSQACDTCKKRKEKCDGQLPCEQCRFRRRGESCSYRAAQPRNNSTNSTSPTDSNTHQNSQPREGEVSRDGSVSEVERLLDAPSRRYAPYMPSTLNTSGSISAPVPKQSRMLKDGKGKLIYIGESASLSFLQTIRRTVAETIGPCAFTTDSLRHQMIEKEPPSQNDALVEPQLNLAQSLALAKQFYLSISGILDLFDQFWLESQLPAWIADPQRCHSANSPIIYLCLAIGALGRASSNKDEEIAEHSFSYGRHLALTKLMDDPSLLTVQAFSLVTYYMIASCRRNGAFVNLGIAVRAAYALGIHRHEANTAFERKTGIARERAWKSVRVCDLFLSASMGRPPCTSEADCNIPWSLLETSTNIEDSTVPAQVTSAIFRICHIFERILTEVYSKRVVSLELAASISQQHREWTALLPTALKIDGLPHLDVVDEATESQKLGTRIVTMAYYYSIILLARPFLAFYVSSQLPASQYARGNDMATTSVATYADACVNSAIKGIAVARDVAFDELMPKRQPLIINSVFISTLCLGLAYLGDYDRRGWPLDRSFASAVAILQHFSPKNPQSARYTDICVHLKDAVAQYTGSRDDMLLQSSTQLVRNVFGDVSDPTSPQIRTASLHHEQPGNTHAGSSRDNLANFVAGNHPTTTDSLSPYHYAILQESLITTSGTLAGQQNSKFQDGSHVESTTHHYFDAMSTTDPNNFYFGDDVPLFSMMDQLPDEIPLNGHNG